MKESAQTRRIWIERRPARRKARIAALPENATPPPDVLNRLIARQTTNTSPNQATNFAIAPTTEPNAASLPPRQFHSLRIKYQPQSGTTPPQSSQLEPSQNEPLPVRRSKHQLPQHSQRAERSNSPEARPRHFEAQAVRVNQLSADLQAAMSRLKALSDEAAPSEPPVRRSQPSHHRPQASTVRSHSSSAPQANSTKSPERQAPASRTTGESSPQASTSSAEFTQAKQDATSTAQLLRRLKRRQRRLARTSGQKPVRARRRKYRIQFGSQLWQGIQAGLRPPESWAELLSDAVVWVAIAAALRVGLKLLINIYPVLAIPVVLLLVTPAMLIAYQVVFDTKSGSLWGYRLLLVVAGLLLGGRL